MRIDIALIGIVRISGQVLDSNSGYIENAIVSVNDKFDTTDNNGKYDISVVETNMIILSCIRYGFTRYLDSLSILPGYQSIDIHLLARPTGGESIIDTLYVYDDADVGNGDFNYSGSDTANYGQSWMLNAGYNLWYDKPDPMEPGRTYYYINWSYIKLPSLPIPPDSALVVSAELVMQVQQCYFMGIHAGHLRVTEALGDWREDSITWNNKPWIADQDTVLPVAAGSNFQVDVKDFYGGTKYQKGLVIRSFTIDEHPPFIGCCFDEFTYLYSSENDSTLRPIVIIQYEI